MFGSDDAVYVSDTPVSSVEVEQDRAFLNGRGVDLRNYKRVRLNMPRVLPGSISRTLPVSYTHLDVYKRQDQAAVKTVDGFEFYGGISHGVEKRSHVRSRIISNALCDLIKRSDSVIIMGHRMGDLDAVGSAVGVLRMCKTVSYTHLDVYKRQGGRLCQGPCGGAVQRHAGPGRLLQGFVRSARRPRRGIAQPF